MPHNFQALRKKLAFRHHPAASAPDVEPAPVVEPEPEPVVEPVVVAPEPEPVVEPEWSMDNTKAELFAAADAAGITSQSGWTKADYLAALQA